MDFTTLFGAVLTSLIPLLIQILLSVLTAGAL